MFCLRVSESRYKRFVSEDMDISKCGAEHDRDINAAKNILTEGLRQIA